MTTPIRPKQTRWSAFCQSIPPAWVQTLRRISIGATLLSINLLILLKTPYLQWVGKSIKSTHSLSDRLDTMVLGSSLLVLFHIGLYFLGVVCYELAFYGRMKLQSIGQQIEQRAQRIKQQLHCIKHIRQLPLTFSELRSLKICNANEFGLFLFNFIGYTCGKDSRKVSQIPQLNDRIRQQLFELQYQIFREYFYWETEGTCTTRYRICKNDPTTGHYYDKGDAFNTLALLLHKNQKTT